MASWMDDPKFKRPIGADLDRGVTMTSHTGRYCSECKTVQVRRGQKTCSPACRKKRQRRQQQARLAQPLAMHELGKIRDSIKRRERVPDFIADLKYLRQEINDLLLLAGEIDQKELVSFLNQRRLGI